MASTLEGRLVSPAFRKLVPWMAAVALVVVRGAAAQPCQVFSDCNPSLNPCIVVDCVGGQCTSGAKDCSDGDACTHDTCDQFLGCRHAPLCPDDGAVCNGAPRCIKIPNGFGGVIGFCEPPVPLDCESGSKCSIDSCVEPTGCQHVAVDCNDGNPCTTDSCDAATGCIHMPVAGCCRTGADCPTDKCSTRRCEASVCTDPAPISCDDHDASTTDACDPTTGCTHVRSGATTTTTVPATACRSDAECPGNPDPCLAPSCGTDGRCGTRALVGLANLGCICRRADPAACDGQKLPHAFTVKRTRACKAIAQATLDAKKARKLAGKAVRLLTGASRIVAHAKQASGDCRNRLAQLLNDGALRATAVRQQLGTSERTDR